MQEDDNRMLAGLDLVRTFAAGCALAGRTGGRHIKLGAAPRRRAALRTESIGIPTTATNAKLNPARQTLNALIGVPSLCTVHCHACIIMTLMHNASADGWKADTWGFRLIGHIALC